MSSTNITVDEFIVVVPSVAIREGVYKSFKLPRSILLRSTERRFVFIYNSVQLTEIDRFASDSSINVMIINRRHLMPGAKMPVEFMKLTSFVLTDRLISQERIRF